MTAPPDPVIAAPDRMLPITGAEIVRYTIAKTPTPTCDALVRLSGGEYVEGTLTLATNDIDGVDQSSISLGSKPRLSYAAVRSRPDGTTYYRLAITGNYREKFWGDLELVFRPIGRLETLTRSENSESPLEQLHAELLAAPEPSLETYTAALLVNMLRYDSNTITAQQAIDRYIALYGDPARRTGVSQCTHEQTFSQAWDFLAGHPAIHHQT